MAAPNLGMRMNAAQEEQFGGGAATDQHHTRVALHDLAHYGRNLLVRKSASPVGSERRERSVIVKHECTLARTPQLSEERRIGVMSRCDGRRYRMLLRFEHTSSRTCS